VSEEIPRRKAEKLRMRFITVGWKSPTGPALLFDAVTADIGLDYDPPSATEMQRLAYAVKREWWKIVREGRAPLGPRRTTGGP
jgi:hypothetical protein